MNRVEFSNSRKFFHEIKNILEELKNGKIPLVVSKQRVAFVTVVGVLNEEEIITFSSFKIFKQRIRGSSLSYKIRQERKAFYVKYLNRFYKQVKKRIGGLKEEIEISIGEGYQVFLKKKKEVKQRKIFGRRVMIFSLYDPFEM